VSALVLQKQVYGNFLGVTYNSEVKVNDLPPNFEGGTRSLHGDIYNLYTINRSDTSGAQAGFPLHMLEGDETYHYYAGDGALTLYEFDLEALVVRNISIGASVPGRDRPQHTIAGRTWTGALLAEGTSWALTGAGTTPGFDPRDSHMAADNKTFVTELHRLFPNQRALIGRLTSFN
jgi:predicted cupin superfamily sugar epimerase